MYQPFLHSTSIVLSKLRPNGRALSCGTANFHIVDNETSSLYQLSIKHSTCARHA
jgi:hypothetical protein